MPGAFGLLDDHHTRVPRDLIVEANTRLDAFWLGALPEGAQVTLQIGHGGSLRLVRKAGVLEIEGKPFQITWDEPMPGVSRPWWECPICSRRCRYLYLRDVVACQRCFRLDWASRHLRRQTPGVARVEKLRRKLYSRDAANYDVRPFGALPPLRRGRSRAYHDKLIALIHDEEAKLIGHLQSVTHDLERRIRIRKARGEW